MKKKFQICVLIPLGLLAVSLSVSAQNTAVSWHTFDTGFAVSTSSNTACKSAIGQVFVGSAPGENTLVQSGFLTNAFQGSGIVEYMPGDINADGVIDVLDILTAVNHILGRQLLSGDALRRADCNGDEEIDVLDALSIVNVILGTGQCAPGLCRTEPTPEAIAFFKALKPHMPPEDFTRFMALVKAEVGIPTEYSLDQNYPNPFNPVTSIEYSLPEDAKVKVEVYNVLGQVVDVLVDSQQEAGYHTLQWDASDMASGVYFYKLTVDSGQWSAMRRMVLMK